MRECPHNLTSAYGSEDRTDLTDREEGGRRKERTSRERANETREEREREQEHDRCGAGKPAFSLYQIKPRDKADAATTSVVPLAAE